MTDQPTGENSTLGTSASPADSQTDGESGPPANADPYRVLARKYRPTNFDDLIGQEALVRTLTNALETGRMAHAFILTGVRGVGKTTTARIIARALNCVGTDGNGGPTPQPCGKCEFCVSIAQDRHVDVIEMDAASRTGVADIRELIEGVRYRPVSARMKVYIIDEVHMLSNNAFNALLKTLEEPPEHVIFIFATTEIRKVPVTVLSRCQRFDLRRVEHDILAAHFSRIAKAESVEIDDEALGMLARAADGSVRDGLSLLDQAIALGGRKIDAGQVRDMLGLADRTRVLDLFDSLMRGATPEALGILQDLYASGADPAVVLQDLMDFTHFLTRARLTPESLNAPGVPEAERRRGKELAEKLSMPVLTRTWQILLKGLGEVQNAPNPLQATEMILIRLAYASELPTPGDLIKQLQSTPQNAAAAPGGAGASPSGAQAGAGMRSDAVSSPEQRPQDAAQPATVVTSHGGTGTAMLRAVEPEAQESPELAAETSPEEPQPKAAPSPTAPVLPRPKSFADVIELARSRREAIVAAHLVNDVHLVSFAEGAIEFRPNDDAPRDLANRLGNLLQDWTGRRWMVSVSSEAGAPSIRNQQDTLEANLTAVAMEDPLVKAVMGTFPGAKVVARRNGTMVPPEENFAPRRDDETSDLDDLPIDDDLSIDE
ncbi:DNA polymerase III subunit gamma/tau [Denitrobaculum tricleocarpae]|uniref:DNA polymerase III subunit gamma/tau n=1 Tax=Denitrobaculum tricleocarpae TaxID=2591009 RepID=A0A545U199_9PROT|nr:DNA polymerase III subunit gamma/tau [Denitrobaculum tricleocarpae]TQV83259.1 DNA polymerase III subunit gamma/tau [Denitrobaculum tricleocarpae]